MKRPTIFASLMSMTITPPIDALILFWMVDADGIIGATLRIIL
ncbi:MAG: hypothetical protein ACU0CI_11600 [Shimia sp.]